MLNLEDYILLKRVVTISPWARQDIGFHLGGAYVVVFYYAYICSTFYINLLFILCTLISVVVPVITKQCDYNGINRSGYFG